MKFTHLHVHSDNSLLDGYGKIDEYLEIAKEDGQTALALTDHNTMTGIYKFIKKAKSIGIKPIPGIEINMAPINELGAKNKTPIQYDTRQYVLNHGAATHLTLLAKNNIGLKNLFKLLHLSYKPENYYNVPRIDLNILKQYSDGIICLSGCANSEMNIRLRLGDKENALKNLNELKSIFKDDFYLELIAPKSPIGYSIEDIIQLAIETKTKIVFTNDVHYAQKSDSPLQERFMALGGGNKMDETPTTFGGLRKKFPDNERNFKTTDEMISYIQKTYSEIDKKYLGSALKTTQEIADKIEEITLEYNPTLRPKLEIPSQFNSSYEYLKHLINQGFKKKRSHKPKEIQAESVKRVKEELEVIYSNDFVDYFLVVWDYIKWTRDAGYGVGGGRGCFLPYSSVKLDTGKSIPIQDIKVGDYVKTHDNKFNKVDGLWKFNAKKENCVSLYLSNGHQIKCTSDHELYKKNFGFIEAKYLKPNDILLKPKSEDDFVEYNGKNIKVSTISNKLLKYPVKYKEMDEKYFNQSEIIEDEFVYNDFDYIKRFIENPEELAKLTSNGHKYIKNKFYSLKSNKTIYYSNPLEYKALKILETESEVSSISNFGHILKYKSYKPTFFIKLKNGKKVVIDVKKSTELKEFLKKDYRRIKGVFTSQNIKYLVWTENEIINLNNLRYEDIIIINTKNFKYSGPVYDLAVENVYNYTISDVTVHNSVGGSEIAYLLDISRTDPIRFNLLFERFISPGRGATYLIEYDDGTTEEINVAEKKTLSTGEQKYIYQLEDGDEIIE